MDGFSYVNIFATKSMEYVLTIAFFLLLVPFWILLNRQIKVTAEIRDSLKALTARALKIPRGVFFSPHHTWTFLGADGKAKVGVDDLLQHLTGDVAVKMIKEKGEMVKKGEVVAELTRGEKNLNVIAPVSGPISGVNIKLLEEPMRLNVDPYAKGWLLKIDPENWKEETREYYLADSAEEYLEKELGRFKDFLGHSLAKHSPGTPMVALQDGGEIMDNTLAELPEAVWSDFQKEFLD